MVNQHTLRTTTQFSFADDFRQNSQKKLGPDVVDGLLFIGFSLSTTMLSNFDFLDLKILAVIIQGSCRNSTIRIRIRISKKGSCSGSFISGT